LCPHAHHPSPEFQALMVQNETETQWQERTGLLAAGYMDAWLIWQVPEEVTTCRASAGLNLTKVLSVPWDAHTQPYDGISSTCRIRQVPSSRRSLAAAFTKQPWQGTAAAQPQPARTASAKRKYCALEAPEPLLVQPGSRTASIGGNHFPMACNAEA
jgi:hypothetical protein